MITSFIYFTRRKNSLWAKEILVVADILDGTDRTSQAQCTTWIRHDKDKTRNKHDVSTIRPLMFVESVWGQRETPELVN